MFEAVPCKKEGVICEEGHGAGVIYVQQTGDEAEGSEADADIEVDLVKAVRSSFSSLLRICLCVHFYVIVMGYDIMQGGRYIDEMNQSRQRRKKTMAMQKHKNP